MMLFKSSSVTGYIMSPVRDVALDGGSGGLGRTPATMLDPKWHKNSNSGVISCRAQSESPNDMHTLEGKGTRRNLISCSGVGWLAVNISATAHGSVSEQWTFIEREQTNSPNQPRLVIFQFELQTKEQKAGEDRPHRHTVGLFDAHSHINTHTHIKKKIKNN